ncbi:isoprenylcysteine carboxylmethyltransferase family protein [Streptomyces sp.]|uniref:methyltransferase family protein n=1 Tax=Streptomyces sp. TaxID=1931 RepID=UPI002D77268A|nr:isoprenylcysteine carboxylmethyltransferase family protein [Streptomyces sp.]HET6357765.1 isoprenylcysteine carboxylmethyltransferase family protein [Streptomyces sp.]
MTRPRHTSGTGLESLFPPALFAAGLIALSWTLIRESGHWSDPRHRAQAVLIGLYLIWTLLELRITFRTAPEESGGDDRGTMQWYGAARGVVVGAALFVDPWWQGWGSVQWLSAAVFVGGAALRLAAIHRLGRFYSHKVRTLGDHQVVRSGPYRVVRHPAYSGMVLAHAGFVGVFANPLSVLALLALLLPAVVLRIRAEEQTLMDLRGYAEYARHRKRLIPAVW